MAVALPKPIDRKVSKWRSKAADAIRPGDDVPDLRAGLAAGSQYVIFEARGDKLAETIIIGEGMDITKAVSTTIRGLRVLHDDSCARVDKLLTAALQAGREANGPE